MMILVTTTAPHRRRRVAYIAGGAVALLLLAGRRVRPRPGRGATQNADPTPPPVVSVAPPTNAATTAPTVVDQVAPHHHWDRPGRVPRRAGPLHRDPARAGRGTLDVNGAAAFARTAFRYLAKAYPRPADYSVVIPQVFVDPWPMVGANLQTSSATPHRRAPPPHYVRPNETTYQATMTGDNADVTVNLFVQLDYPDGNARRSSVTQRFLLTIEDGRWLIADTPPTDALPPAGTGGSLYFVGAC